MDDSTMDSAAPDISASPAAAMDPGSFSGSQAPPPPPPAGTTPSGAPTLGADTSVGSQRVATGLSPDGTTYTVPAASQMPLMGGQTSPWKNLVMGALFGAAAGAGTKNFGTGAAAGAAAVTQQQINQKQLQFESVRAADTHIAARNSAMLANTENQEQQLQLSANYASYNAWAARNGLQPVTQISADNPTDFHAQAIGGLNGLATANGGAIPAITTVNSGKGAGDNPAMHQLTAFAATPANIKSVGSVVDPTTTSVPNMVNEARRAQGLLPYKDSDWSNLGISPNNAGPMQGMAASAQVQAAQKEAVEKAMLFMNVPTPAAGENGEQITAKSAPILSQAQDDLQRYTANGGTDQTTLKQLQSRIDTLKGNISQVADLADQRAASRAIAADPDKAPASLDQVSAFLKTTLPGYGAIDKSELPGLQAEANAAKTTKDLTAVQNRALTLQQAGVSKQLAADNAAAAKDQAKSNSLAVDGVKEVNKQWIGPQGFGQTLAQANVGRSAIKAGADGNGLLTSLEPTMAVLGVNSFAGTHRISPAEAQAAGAPGGWAEQFNAWATKSSTGRLTPQLAQEGQQLFNTLTEAKFNQSLQASRQLAANAKLDPSQITVQDRRGNPDTLDHQIKVNTQPPNAGGVGTVGGKRVWVAQDRKTILGPAE